MLAIVPLKNFVARHPVIGVLILLGGVGFLLFLGLGLKHQYDSANPITIEIVLPDDFLGMAAVRFSARDGKLIEPHNRKVTYDIPASGELKVRGEHPQYQSHVVVARRISGQKLPVGYLGDEFAADQVVVWPLLLDGDDAGCFVGNMAARKQLPKTLK